MGLNEIVAMSFSAAHKNMLLFYATVLLFMLNKRKRKSNKNSISNKFQNKNMYCLMDTSTTWQKSSLQYNVF